MNEEFYRLQEQVEALQWDLDKSQKEALKWKNAAKHFYQLWRNSKGLFETDTKLLTQISRRMEKLSKDMDKARIINE